jgi:type II secretory pathway component PulF
MSRFTNFIARRQMTARRIQLLSDLAIILQSEKPNVEQALRRVADRNSGKPIERAYRDVISALNSGKHNGLADTVASYFPAREFMVVKAFDVGAKSDMERGQGFALAASIMKPLNEIRYGFIKLGLSALISFALIFLLWLVIVPEFAGVIGIMLKPEQWPWISQIAYSSSNWIRQYWWIMLPAFLGFAAWLVWAFPRWTGRMRRSLDRWMPGLVIYREYRSTLSLISLSCFMRARLGLDWAFKQVLGMSKPWEAEYIEAMFKRSNQYAASRMLDVGYFSDPVIDRLAILEGSTSLEESLHRIALEGINDITKQMNDRLNMARALLVDISKLIGGLLAFSMLLLLLAAQQALSNLAR